jgi:hypothetical protein
MDMIVKSSYIVIRLFSTCHYVINSRSIRKAERAARMALRQICAKSLSADLKVRDDLGYLEGQNSNIF